MENIIVRFEEMAERHADSLALITAKEQLTYGDLNGFANQIANIVLSRTGDGNYPVVLFSDQSSVEHVAALLGILKAGKILVPLNPHPQTLKWGVHSYLPGGYVDSLLKKLEVELVLSDHANWEMATSFSAKVINIELALSASSHNPGICIEPSMVATIIHTSGTTGTVPKAVVRQHNFETYTTEMAMANDPPIGPGDRSTVFRLHLHDVLYPLLNGATLCSLDLTNPIGEWLTQNDITVFRSSATALRMLQPGRYPSIKHVNIGGEIITAEDARFCDRVFPNGELTHRYACTEMSVMAHNGKALGDRQFSIMEDETGRPGGQIVVDSNYTAVGYLHDGELTMQRFLPLPNGMRRYLTGDRGSLVDGRLVVLGRMP